MVFRGWISLVVVLLFCSCAKGNIIDFFDEIAVNFYEGVIKGISGADYV
jgi:hypothetical protein